jgi:hypothetical protein
MITKYFAQSAKPSMTPSSQCRVEEVPRPSPYRQLNDVVIELGRGVLKVVQAIDYEDGEEREDRSDHGACGEPDACKCADDRRLRQGIVADVAAHRPVNNFHQPPGQRRQLVVAKLPFTAIGQGLDEVERKVRVKQGRKGGPNREVKREKSEKGQLRPALDDAAKSRRRAGNCPPLRNASAPEGFASRILHWSAAYRPPMRLRLG